MSEPTPPLIRVLAVDDLPEDLEFCLDCLQTDGRFECQGVPTAAEAIELANTQQFDACVLDYELTDSDGLTLLQTLSSTHMRFPIPATILVTGRGDETLATSAMKSGAADYLVKGRVDAQLMRRTVIGAIERTRMSIDLAREHRALLDTRKELLDSLKVRAELVSMASHELRTPLTALQLRTESMVRRLNGDPSAALSSEKVAQFTSFSMRQLARLSRLLDDMLDFSRVESGQMLLTKQDLDLSDLTQKASDKFSTTADETSRVRVEIQEGLVVHGDPVRLEQVIDNFVSNALRYAPSGEIRVSLRGDAGDNAVLTVKDAGPGIEKEDQKNIFNKFSRSEQRNEKSLGLGLFICRAIVEGHSGSIGVDSAPGNGSQFYFRLPLCLASKAPSSWQP